MRVEIDALLLDLAEPSQGEHLKSAGIRKNRTIPVHEFVEASHLFYNFITRTHMEMVGIGQFYLCADFF